MLVYARDFMRKIFVAFVSETYPWMSSIIASSTTSDVCLNFGEDVVNQVIVMDLRVNTLRWIASDG